MSWVPKPLSEILDQSGRHRAGDQDLPVLSITMKHGLVDQADKFKKRVASSDTSNYRIAYKNELVVGFPIDEGVLGFQTKYPAGIVSPAYDVWKLKNEPDCHIPYLERYLRSSQARSQYASRMQGAVARRRSLTKTDFLGLEVPFPPRDDQIRIAHLLGKVEGLIAQRKQHLQQLDDLLKSVFLEMFGDHDKFPFMTLSSIAAEGKGTFSNGPFGSNLLTSELSDTGVPVIYIRDIRAARYERVSTVCVTDEKANELSTCLVQPGDILVAKVGDPPGTTAIYPRGEPIGVMTQDVIRLRPNTEIVNAEFVSAFLNSHFGCQLIREITVEATRARFGLREFKAKEIPIPPMDIQNEFSAISERVESIKTHYQQSLTDLESLYGALSQQAFKGELDLSRVPLPASTGQDNQSAAIDLTPPQAEASEIPELETDPLLSVLKSAPSLEDILHRWLELWRVKLGDAPFSVEDFMAYVQMRLEKLQPDSDFVVDKSHYEYVKAWVFEALADCRLKQTYDDAGNRVQLKAV